MAAIFAINNLLGLNWVLAEAKGKNYAKVVNFLSLKSHLLSADFPFSREVKTKPFLNSFPGK